MNNIEIIALIYKSTQYLDFIANELKSDYCKVKDWNVGLRIIANDATPEVVKKLISLDIPYDIYNDKYPHDYYLNRVYRCWNYGGLTSSYDHLCFVNSDMAFSPGWLENLLKHLDDNTVPCSRLVESGKMPSGKWGVSQNFGTHPNNFNRDAWLKYAEQIKKEEVNDGGLFMPCILKTDTFRKTAGYPEGNIYEAGIGAFRSKFIMSGDAAYFKAIDHYLNIKHKTVFDSIVYHIQEGEMDE